MRDDLLGLSSLRMFPEANMPPLGSQTTRALPAGRLPLSTTPANANAPTPNFANQLAAANARAALLARSNAQLASQLARSNLQAASQLDRGNLQAATQLARTNAQSGALTTSTTAQAATQTARTNTQPLKPYQSPLKSHPNQFTPQAMARPKPTLPQTHTTLPTTTSRQTTSTSYTTPTRPTAPPVQPTEPPKPVTPPDPSATAMALSQYPHPNGDNGRGMHWIPTTSQSPAAVDKFVAEAQRMGVKWVTFLNNGTNVGDNDYLVKKLVGAGIEPIMRVWTPTLQPIDGDLEGMVRHFADLGVHYFQPYNEPNLNDEQPDGKVSVDRYLDNWIPAAQAIIRGGGLPGFGAMAPGGDMDDQQFLTQALQRLKDRGQLGLLDKGWLSMHNYTHNHPIEEPYTDGFFKFRNYHQILSNALGRDLPIIGTEGGTFVGEHENADAPAVDADTVALWAKQAYTYMRDQREPWNFAYSFWTIANDAGGGTDSRFNAEALFKGDGSVSQVVTTLRSMA